MVKLDDGKLLYIIRAKERGIRSRDIASSLSISTRRVEQIYSHYKKYKEIPSIAKAGRKRKDITEYEIHIISNHSGYIGLVQHISKGSYMISRESESTIT